MWRTTSKRKRLRRHFVGTCHLVACSHKLKEARSRQACPDLNPTAFRLLGFQRATCRHEATEAAQGAVERDHARHDVLLVARSAGQ